VNHHNGFLPFEAGSGHHPVRRHCLDLVGALSRLGQNFEETGDDLQLVHLQIRRRRCPTSPERESATMTLEEKDKGTKREETQQSEQISPKLSPPSVTKDQPPKDLEAALTLLKKSDDTSRFVGLALLKPVLEQKLNDSSNAGVEARSALVQRCWAAIPVKFIDRLLRARANDKRSKEEANNMVGLAVAILHAFMTLLDSPQTDERFMGSIPILRATLRSCPPETRSQIIDIFHILVMTQEGSSAIFERGHKENKPDEEPESYLFITMLLIDIRSTIPSVQEKLHSEESPATSERLSKAYDIISAFIGHLIRSLETTIPMPIDLLLKLRTNISETLSLTIEHLRDRHDSSTAGAAGLHPSARAPSDTSSSTPLPIAWDTSTGLSNDPLTLSQLRTLSLWLRDEENNPLRQEASGIMDVLLALYQHDGAQDFRFPVLVALEGILETSDGIGAFLQNEGWPPLAKDLTTILPQPANHGLGIEIVRTLLTVAESDITGPPKEDWMSIVTLAQTSLTGSTQVSAPELPIAVSQLAIELLTRAPRGMQKRYRVPAQDLLRAARMLSGKSDVREEDRDGLEEVVEGLLGLGL